MKFLLVGVLALSLISCGSESDHSIRIVGSIKDRGFVQYLDSSGNVLSTSEYLTPGVIEGDVSYPENQPDVGILKYNLNDDGTIAQAGLSILTGLNNAKMIYCTDASGTFSCKTL